MKESTLNELSRDFLAVLAGVMITILAAVLLAPLVNMFANSRFQINVFYQSLQNAWKDEWIVRFSLFIWFFLASIAGGVVCTLIAVNRDIILVLISSLVSIALVFILSNGAVVNNHHMINSILIILGIPIGNVLGASMGWKMKRKRLV